MSKESDAELLKRRRNVEGYFKKNWSGLTDEDVSDFGAFCVEQWLKGRDHTAYKLMAIDYLRKHGHHAGIRGCGDMMARPPHLRVHEENGKLPDPGKDSVELQRFVHSAALRDPRLRRDHRIVLILHYEYGYEIKQIADMFGVTVSRISQLHHEAISEQRKRMLEDLDEERRMGK